MVLLVGSSTVHDLYVSYYIGPKSGWRRYGNLLVNFLFALFTSDAAVHQQLKLFNTNLIRVHFSVGFFNNENASVDMLTPLYGVYGPILCIFCIVSENKK